MLEISVFSVGIKAVKGDNNGSKFGSSTRSSLPKLRNMMGSVGVILLVFCCSAVLTKVSATSLISQKCMGTAHKHINIKCWELSIVKQYGREPKGCVEEIVKSRTRTEFRTIAPLRKFIDNYCDRHQRSMIQCVRCFLNAFQRTWGQNECLNADNARLRDVKYCLQSFPREEFSWSHNIIFNNKKDVVDLRSAEYNGCSNQFKSEAFPPSKKISLPVRIRMQPETQEAEINLFTAFLLNTLKAYILSCQDVEDLGFFQNVRALSNGTINVPEEVQDTYLKLRSSMCADSTNRQGCESCFQYADERFLFHTYNRDLVSAVRRDFQIVIRDYNDCIQNKIGRKYLSLKNVINDYKKPWGNFSNNCGDREEVTHEEMITNIESSLPVNPQDESFVQSVFTNYQAFNIYQQLQDNGPQTSCSDVKKSRILCTAARTKLTMLLINRDTTFMNMEDYEKSDLFRYYVQLC